MGRQFYMGSPEATAAVNDFLGGIRQLTFRKLLVLLLILRNERDKSGPLWQRFLETELGQRNPDFDNFLDTLRAEDVAAILGCGERAAWEYLDVLKKLTVLL